MSTLPATDIRWHIPTPPASSFTFEHSIFIYNKKKLVILVVFPLNLLNIVRKCFAIQWPYRRIFNFLLEVLYFSCKFYLEFFHFYIFFWTNFWYKLFLQKLSVIWCFLFYLSKYHSYILTRIGLFQLLLHIFLVI